MKYDGISEFNTGVCKTSQVYVSNYSLIKSMLTGSRFNYGVDDNIEIDDTMADKECYCCDGSIYDQGLDDVSFNIEVVQKKIPEKIKTNDFFKKSAVEKQVSKVEKDVKDDAK